MSEPVYILSTWVSTPRYHDFGRYDVDRGVDLSKCGLILYDRGSKADAYMPRDRADLFAVPCAKCYPPREGVA